MRARSPRRAAFALIGRIDESGRLQGCDLALTRLERAGAVVSTVEAVLFELLERAGTPEFKQVQRLVL